MPGCAAVGCNNRSEKGYIMKCFPRDAKLRKIWQERVGRADWEPSNNSFLCHVHFQPQEWSITHSGRIKLKKGAVPSIFTITSTRKSPKKRMKITNIKQEQQNVIQNEYMLDGFEIDTDFSSTGNAEGKDSDFCQIIDHSNEAAKLQILLQNTNLDKNNLKNYNQIDNNELNVDGKYINAIVKKVPVMNENKLMMENLDIGAQSICNIKSEKTEIKPEETDIVNDGYDEIEEKLKLICHEEPVENKVSNQINGEGSNTNNNIVNVYAAFNNERPLKNEISQTSVDKREQTNPTFNIKISDDRLKLMHSAKRKTSNSIKKENSLILDTNKKCIKGENHVVPNIKAAMKRKRHTREEILKSLKQSIGNVSEDESYLRMKNDIINYIKNMSDSEIDYFHESDNVSSETFKFTIKVTGDPNDVCEIVDELSINADSDIQTISNHQSNGLITSVITVQEDAKIFSSQNLNQLSCSGHEEQSINNHDYSASKNMTDYGNLMCQNTSSSNKLNQDPMKSLEFNIQEHIKNSNSYIISKEFENLQEKIKLQENVIEKLTNQLITYKRLENKMLEKNAVLDARLKQAELLTVKLNKKADLPVFGGKKYLESKQRLITDLGNRVNYMEGITEKLMKTVTLESQDRRKLESQLKQKEDRIKELNWKLEKASKYLERAEKNTNTYKRKMLNMQTVMRRKKLLDEKMSRFSEMLTNDAKGEFSDKTICTAIEIEKTCKQEGYNKLLACGFPLPPLSIVHQKLLSNRFTNCDVNNQIAIGNTKETTMYNDNFNIKRELDMKTISSSIPEIDTKEMELENAGTITGTVQDIFDENNDCDFSTNDLKEHFIMEINSVM
ncbi:putative leucine-rich repeat-containing protein DDB_G0290503 [Prorops nasuta]|uniref:putative leucine-rich repeat-containing protein DDB_G0290503 n=1 Tax=Prorops nasuta TaxID=863751 RepID=UPI0034CD7F28